jgi:hypothetical protein
MAATGEVVTDDLADEVVLAGHRRIGMGVGRSG